MNDTLAAIASILGAFLAGFICTVIVFWRTNHNTVKTIATNISAAIQEPTKKLTDSADNMIKLVETLASNNAAALDVGKYLVGANTRLVDKNTELNLRVDQADMKTKDLEGRVETYARSLDDLLHDQEEQAKARKERDAKIQTLDDKMKTMNDVLSDTQKTLQATQVELEATKLALAQAQARIAELERQRDEERKLAASEKARLESELATERQKVTTLQAQVQNLQAQVDDLKSQLKRDIPTPTDV